MEKITNTSGKFMLLLLAIVTDVFYAFVTSKLWNWFVVPVFDVKRLSVPIAYGLILLISSIHSRNVKDEEIVQIVVDKLCKGIVWLTAGYLASFFI